MSVTAAKNTQAGESRDGIQKSKDALGRFLPTGFKWEPDIGVKLWTAARMTPPKASAAVSGFFSLNEAGTPHPTKMIIATPKNSPRRILSKFENGWV
jgi:hypothetical protein